jgi:hypothetical protein
MKITKSRLKQIITEELQNILAEEDDQDDPFAPGSTQYMKPGEREAARRARAAAKTAKVDIRSKAAADRRTRGEIRQRAEKLLNVLYPDASNQELVFTIRQEDDEGTLVDSLFGFMFPRETTMDKPNPYLMDRVEEWIATFDNPQNAALEVGGRSNPQTLDSLLTYIETKGMELGKQMFDKAKADAAGRPARNVPVGRAATPGTPERAALDRLMSVEVPPKRRR